MLRLSLFVYGCLCADDLPHHLRELPPAPIHPSLLGCFDETGGLGRLILLFGLHRVSLDLSVEQCPLGALSRPKLQEL